MGFELPEASLKKYLSIVPTGTKKTLFLQSRRVTAVTASSRYTTVPLGVNQMSQMLPRMCTEAGTHTSYTTHTLRVSAIQKLSDAGLEAKIMPVSGQSRDALYKHTDTTV